MRAEDVVGVLLPSSPDLVAALLGTLKAGATYLPLDPGYPPDRLAYMVADAAPRALITTREAAAGLDLPTGADPGAVLYLDQREDRQDAVPARPGPYRLRPGPRRLHHLHLGFHGPPQGRCRHAPFADELPGLSDGPVPGALR